MPHIFAVIPAGSATTFDIGVGEDGDIKLTGAGPCAGHSFVLTIVDVLGVRVVRQGVITDDVTGAVTFSLVTNDTIGMKPGRASYDIWQTDTTGMDRQIARAQSITVLPSIRALADIPTSPTPQQILAYPMPPYDAVADGYLHATGGTLSWDAVVGGGGGPIDIGYFNPGADIVFDAQQDRTIGIADSTTANVKGADLYIRGASATAGNAAGGGVMINGGARSGTENYGPIWLGAENTAGVLVGALDLSTHTIIFGSLELNGGPITTGLTVTGAIVGNGGAAILGDLEVSARILSANMSVIDAEVVNTLTVGGASVLTATPIDGLTPGAYTSANITVDAYGRVTAAASGSGGGPAAPLTLTMDGIGTARTVALTLANTTAAASGNPQYSPATSWKGSYFAGTSKTIEWTAQLRPSADGTTNVLTFSQSLNGGAYYDVMAIRYEYGETQMIGLASGNSVRFMDSSYRGLSITSAYVMLNAGGYNTIWDTSGMRPYYDSTLALGGGANRWSALYLGTTAAKPAASSGERGNVYLQQNAGGAGTADVLSVCVWDGSAYVWKTVTLA